MSANHPIFAAFGLLGLLLLASGCAAPCDRYCDSTADLIEYCLENGSSTEWLEAQAQGGWTVFGATERDEYATTCKADMDSQVAAGGDVIESECTDAANRNEENTERGFCVDLP